MGRRGAGVFLYRGYNVPVHCTIYCTVTMYSTVTIFLYRCYNDPPGISCIHDHPQDDEEDDETAKVRKEVILNEQK